MTSTVTAAPKVTAQIDTPRAAGGRQRRRAGWLAGLAAAAALTLFGAASLVKGLDGRSTVRDALAQEKIVGSPHMTPAAIKTKAIDAGLRDVRLPTCSVAGERVVDGSRARCFAEYMRIDALLSTAGATYAEMPRFATDDGRGTNDPAAARQGANGEPVSNTARDVWVTETALSTALNTSYMAEQISLFGIAVGLTFLLIGLACAVAVLARRRTSTAATST